MSSSDPHRDPSEDDEPEMLAEDDVQEVLEDEDAEGDVAMGSDDEDDEEMVLHNDSIAYFDGHKDSVFAIAQHPLYPNLIATGGSEGDADDAPGKGYVIDTSAAVSRPVLPPSYNADPDASAAPQTTALQPLFAIDGHTDSINALTFTLPRGDFLVSGGMDGRLRVHAVAASANPAKFKFLAESQETEEINWLAPCPSADYPNTIALGASDGSVWVLTLNTSDPSNPIQIVQTYFLHTGPCTAGAWTPDGLLLATVSEDASLHVYDVWGAAAAKSLVTDNGQTVVSLTDTDQRFAVEGGLYSVAVSPTGSYLAVGGAGGAIRIVGLPRLLSPQQQQQKPSQQPRGGTAAAAAANTQAGTILAALAVQSDSVESLAFSPSPSNPLLAAGSVDGSIAVFDTSRSFAVRRHLRGVHDGESVVRVEFVRAAAPAAPAAAAGGWLLTSCGLDGVVRRWDLRGATASSAAASAAAGASAGSGLVKEWRGHRGGGDGGGVLGFVQGETGERVVTAGDDGVVLVFEA
ncbi:WD40-repeat-containing domain protein [Chaetomidium leptoderma]|uniref:WD40-repeat-containing domain protein n=1 Tax=Chaetomidium leptoderma TaxID=669021 RepID=A0AAN6VTA2_9PEZI|nr:WD40-repeat-containing domain protein [Chaetomidium leptoderma]